MKQISEQEKEILEFWQDNKIFEKSLKKDSPNGDYVFYDGPPFATGLPHYGHFVPSIMKDVIPRFWTMRGYRVERVWGWDCHGLPIENIVEKQLGFKNKKDIEKYGIDKFNETCRSKVLAYAAEWKKTIPRLGRWADLENPYQTMDLGYMESVWWVFKKLWDKGLIYEGYKSMHVCPRCETTLSQQEVAEGYKEIKDLAVVVKFELVKDPGAYMLAWTTTPWTLPGNVALALGKKIDYVKVEAAAKFYILAEEKVKEVFGEQKYRVIGKINVKDLVGQHYQPLFDYYSNQNLKHQENLYTIITGEFVNIQEGTGIVHIAPAFGEDDMNAGKENDLPFIQHVEINGLIKEEVSDFAGLAVKPIANPASTDEKIVKKLEKDGLLFSQSYYQHSYPHCWRCDTPLLNYATSSWFVNILKIKDQAIKLAKQINWSPAHIKEGRFGKWLAGARDWSISRQRFWASVMPIWKCECGEIRVFGSVAELETASGDKITDLHKHIIDKVTVVCQKCQSEMKRIPDVLDTWFDSGSMPYAQLHYPFANKDKLEKNFPAEFIAEATDQTRAWFYYLHVIGTAIKEKPAFKNVIVNGIVLAEDGKKMSKKLNNYPDPSTVMEKYGADALRYYLLSSPVMAAESINFSEKEVKEALQKNIMLIGNVLSFYLIYAKAKNLAKPKTKNILDQWILAKLNQLIAEVTKQLEDYNLVKATRPIGEFINELSTWYVRRSRANFRDGDQAAINTLGFVLLEFSKVIAPFVPFTAENIYRQVGGRKESVHLEDWPASAKTSAAAARIFKAMELARQIVEKGLAARAEAGIKVRQVLASFTTSLTKELDQKLVELIKDELNVKALKFGKTDELETEITEELKKEGLAREIIRQINQLRKEQKLTMDDKVIIYQDGLDRIFAEFGEVIKKATLAAEIKKGSTDKIKEVEGGKISIKKI